MAGQSIQAVERVESSRSTNDRPSKAIAHIAQDDYLRERLTPAFGDALYLHLSDLRMAMAHFATDGRIKILDFGCGGSPYRSLFPNAVYHRADIAGTADIDFVIPTDDESVSLPIADNSYDLVLSSQVLEHVPSPAAYLAECRRLLRHDGRLVLTTHGMFEDHGCPHDYFRWTDSGLRRDLAGAGLRTTSLWKLTTGMRAILFLLESSCRWQTLPQPLRWALWPYAHLVSRRPWWLHRQCDEHFGGNRVVAESLELHRIYIGLACVAEPID